MGVVGYSRGPITRSFLDPSRPTSIFNTSSILFSINGPHASTSSSSSSVNGPYVSTSSSSSTPLRHHHRHSSPGFTRRWVEADTHTSHISNERFSVVSYNILADKNVKSHKYLYKNVPSEYINWEHRKRLICEELLSLSPDIICLQEVDKYDDLLSVLENAGYVGSFKRRTGGNVDGCAMFWKAEKLRLLEEVSIEYKQYGLRDNVAQLFVLEVNVEARMKRIVVGNIHVLYNPSRGDVKMGQIRSLLLSAHILSEKWGDAPVVLAGDYNSTPESAIYKFLSLSELNILLYDRKELSGQRRCNPAPILGVRREINVLFALMNRFTKRSWTDEEVRVASGSTSALVMHPLNLNSSYANVMGSWKTRGSGGEPLATSYHSSFLGTVDYLWYSAGLVPVRVLDTLSIDSLRSLGGLPSKKLGSDHLALVTEFSFKQDNTESIVNSSSF